MVGVIKVKWLILKKAMMGKRGGGFSAFEQDRGWGATMTQMGE